MEGKMAPKPSRRTSMLAMELTNSSKRRGGGRASIHRQPSKVSSMDFDNTFLDDDLDDASRILEQQIIIEDQTYLGDVSDQLTLFFEIMDENARITADHEAEKQRLAALAAEEDGKDELADGLASSNAIETPSTATRSNASSSIINSSVPSIPSMTAFTSTGGDGNQPARRLQKRPSLGQSTRRNHVASPSSAGNGHFHSLTTSNSIKRVHSLKRGFTRRQIDDDSIASQSHMTRGKSSQGDGHDHHHHSGKDKKHHYPTGYEALNSTLIDMAHSFWLAGQDVEILLLQSDFFQVSLSLIAEGIFNCTSGQKSHLRKSLMHAISAACAESYKCQTECGRVGFISALHHLMGDHYPEYLRQWACASLFAVLCNHAGNQTIALKKPNMEEYLVEVAELNWTWWEYNEALETMKLLGYLQLNMEGEEKERRGPTFPQSQYDDGIPSVYNPN